MAIINCKVAQNSGWYKVYIEYSYTQNIEANTSTITAALKLQQLTDSYDFDTVSAVTVGFSMAGSSYSSTKRINIDNKGNAGYTITLASGTKTVEHGSDGKKTISFSCSNTSSLLNCSGWGTGSITLSSTSIELKQIPRNAKIDKITNSGGMSISSANVDASIKVYYTPTASSYYHQLLFYVGNTKMQTANLGQAGTASQKSYTLSSIPAAWMSSGVSGTLTCKLYTYSDSAYSASVGSASSWSISLSVPSTSMYNPTAALSITPTYNNNLNVYLKNISKATFKITGVAGSGASISAYQLSGTGVSSTKASTTATLSTSGDSLKYTASVTDSRGRSASASQSITVYNYSKPTLSSGRVTRCDSEGKVTASGTYALGYINAAIAGVSGKNSISSLTWSYRELGSSSWKTLGAISNKTDTRTSITFSTSVTYQFRFTVTDAVGTSINSKIFTMSASGRPLNMAKYNNGLAVGKLSSVETDDANASKFECAWPAEFDGALTANGNVVTSGNFGCNGSYDSGNFAAYCQWADGQNHDILVRATDGLSMGIGWAGSDTHPTSLDIRPKKVGIRGDIVGGIKLATSNNIFKGRIHNNDTPDANTLYFMTGKSISGGDEVGLAVNQGAFYVTGETNNGMINLGAANRKWNQLYAANSTISTSDRNKKKDIESMSDTQEALFNQLKPATYKMINGTSDRTHYGFIAQDVEDALSSIGASGKDFAGFCKDVRADESGNKTLDENGNEIYDYSLRYAEFIALNTYMIQKLQNEITELKAEIKTLKETAQN